VVTISRPRLLFSLAVGLTAVSFASILIRFAQREEMSTLAIATWRLVFASAVLLPYGALRRRDEIRALARRDWACLALSGVFLGLHFATWIGSLAYTSVASAAVLVSMGPVFVALGSWLLLRERPGLLLATGIVLAAAGSVVISWGDWGQGSGQLLGDLLALLGGVMVAGYLMIGRAVRGRLSLTTYATVVYGAAMVTLLIVSAALGQALSGFAPAAYAWVLALALGPQLVGHSILNWALRYLSATFVSVVILAEPVGSGLLAYLILGEVAPVSTLAGGALVLAGLYLASRAELGAPAGSLP
jgi:drug/metabolite transporter (DMT)-like permease